MEKTTNNWLCYLIKSVDSNRTYIGATNNLLKRLHSKLTEKGLTIPKGIN